MKRQEGPDETVVAIALIEKADCFLVGRRDAKGPLPGYAEFPGGKCLPGEKPEDCVVRECREETGVEVIVRSLRRELAHTYPHARLRLMFFDCEPQGDGQARQGFHWVRRQDLGLLDFPEANKAVISELMAGELPETQWSNP